MSARCMRDFCRHWSPVDTGTPGHRDTGVVVNLYKIQCVHGSVIVNRQPEPHGTHTHSVNTGEQRPSHLATDGKLKCNAVERSVFASYSKPKIIKCAVYIASEHGRRWTHACAYIIWKKKKNVVAIFPVFVARRMHRHVNSHDAVECVVFKLCWK